MTDCCRTCATACERLRNSPSFTIVSLADAGAWDRREYRDLQLCRRRAAEAASLPRCRSYRAGARKAAAGRPERDLNAELPGLEQSEYGLPIYAPRSRVARQRSPERANRCNCASGQVSAHYFDIFGIQAVLGRTFAADEDQPGKEHVVVLSHAIWESQFGADPKLIWANHPSGWRAVHRDRRASRGRVVRPLVCADLDTAGVQAREHDAQLPLV